MDNVRYCVFCEREGKKTQLVRKRHNRSNEKLTVFLKRQHCPDHELEGRRASLRNRKMPRRPKKWMTHEQMAELFLSQMDIMDEWLIGRTGWRVRR